MANVMYDDLRGHLEHGTPVAVRSRFVGSWALGFVVDETVAGGYRIRRLSDNSVLPGVLAEDEIRPERR